MPNLACFRITTRRAASLLWATDFKSHHARVVAEDDVIYQQDELTVSWSPEG